METYLNNLLSSKYRDSSVKTMKSQIVRIHKMASLKKFSIDFLLNFDKVKSLLETISGINSKKAIVNTIAKVLTLLEADKQAISEYNKYFDKLALLKATETKRLDPMLNLNDLENIRDDHYHKRYNSREMYQRYLILCLYTMIPPLRGEDYYKTKIGSNQSNSSENTYDPESGLLTLNIYQTSDIYGQRILKLPSDLMLIINEWIKINIDTKYLFPSKKGHLSQQGFTDIFKRIFNENSISVNHIRKQYINEVLPQLNESQKQDLAFLMAHSLETQNSFIIKMN